MSTGVSTLRFPSKIREIVTRAIDDAAVMIVAAVDKDGIPLLSYRGSVAIFSDNQLSFWARNSPGATLDAIKQNANVALMYRSKTVPFVQFTGRARVVTDPVERNRAFEISHRLEQEANPERTGDAVIVDVTRINGVLARTAEGLELIDLNR
jgi:hypothetical protein